MVSALVGLGRNTVTGMLCTAGRQFEDWSAAYRLFSHERLDFERLSGVVRRGVCEQLNPDAPFIAIMDDTLLRKSGGKIHGCAWRRDPLGPKFQANLVWSQRFFQISAALPVADCPSPARAIPLELVHAPTPAKPGRNACEEEMAGYEKMRKENRLGIVAARRAAALREHLDSDGDASRPLWLVGDGGYTNETTLKNLPERTMFTGRIRGDAKLYHVPSEHRKPRGRKKIYGAPAPTPEKLRADDSIPYQTVEAWAAGRTHSFRIKTIENVMWRKAGESHHLRLIVIAPLGYKLNKRSRILYRNPAHIICTDSTVPPQQIVQAYIWRQGIELNFREQKQILGLGQAQVRNISSISAVPSFLTTAYSMLLLAATRVLPSSEPVNTLPPPKWRSRKSGAPSITTSSLIGRLREELWGKSLGFNSYGFPSASRPASKSQKFIPDLASAVMYMKK